ncbi:hypothetical protein [Mesorhizobium australicum]|uniref:Uncharacterized protein n=1 Tax=Mesorhizobium australicum TaxID=536018 RepID=A0A1X7N5Q0_9HYPH|nr:hypothetical protein [Mesorhizobium australicum]SMH32087.1 hypothetical protein SAMN02982922_1231 [Mesorhizobium australicum]
MSVWDRSDGESGIDWDGVIERNVRLLGPIVATLCVMAGLFERPSARSHSEGPGEGYLPSPTLPRRWHRAVYRLLRAAEAAVRRLIIVVGRDMVAAEPVLAPLKTRSGPLVTHIPVRPGLGLACAGPAEVPAEANPPRKLAFSLLDPLPDPTRPPFLMRSSGVPRMSVPGWTPLFPVAPRHEPSPNDPIDAGYLRRRVDALSRALADLPRQAQRLARWRARCEALRKARRVRRLSTLRPGRAYGLRRPGSPRPEHPIDDILRDLHYFAWEAQEPRDTS